MSTKIGTGKILFNKVVSTPPKLYKHYSVYQFFPMFNTLFVKKKVYLFSKLKWSSFFLLLNIHLMAHHTFSSTALLYKILQLFHSHVTGVF